jgi:hypothetical protein
MINTANVKMNNINGNTKHLYFSKGTQKHGFREDDLLGASSLTGVLLPSLVLLLLPL